jgi:hypothetical protein
MPPHPTRTAGLAFPFASFIKRQTLAREMACFFATCVNDMPYILAAFGTELSCTTKCGMSR